MKRFRVSNIKLLVNSSERNLAWCVSHAQVPRPLFIGDKIVVYFATRGVADKAGNYASSIGSVVLDINDPYTVVDFPEEPAFSPGPAHSFFEHGVMPGHVSLRDNTVEMLFTGWSRRAGKYPYQTWIGSVASYDMGKTFELETAKKIISKRKNNKFLSNGPNVFNNRETGEKFLIYASGDKWVNRDGRWESIYSLKVSAMSNLETHKKLTGYDATICENAPFVFASENENHIMFSMRPSLDFRGSNGYHLYTAKFDGTIASKVEPIIFDDLDDWCDVMQCYASVIEIKKRNYILFNGNYFGRDGFGIGEFKIV